MTCSFTTVYVLSLFIIFLNTTETTCENIHVYVPFLDSSYSFSVRDVHKLGQPTGDVTLQSHLTTRWFTSIVFQQFTTEHVALSWLKVRVTSVRLYKLSATATASVSDS